MAKVVLIVDSETGALVDVVGNSREDGRYFRFANRMLSLSKNPELNYGVNGGDSLVVSKNGSDGRLIQLKAREVKISGTLKIGEQTVQQIVDTRTSGFLSQIKGTLGEVKVERKTDEDTGKSYLQISLDSSVATKIRELEESLERESSSGYISKKNLAEALEDIPVSVGEELEDVRAQLSALVSRLKNLASDEADSGPE